MSVFAFALVILAAFIHAGWNYLAKRAEQGGAAFIWLFATVSSIFYAPIAILFIAWQKPQLGPIHLGFMVGSGLIHVAYFLILQKGYQNGDLSLVYPLARGTGPAISTILAILFLGETPSPLAMTGGMLVVTGVFFLSWTSANNLGHRSAGVVYGLLTGITIAAYTLWDKYAVSTLSTPPLLQDYCTNLARTIMLGPAVFPKWENVRNEWRIHKKEAIGVGLLCPLSYILVLTAMISAPVSYIAPAREMSILIAAFMGTKLLGEGDTRRRLMSAAAIVAGVIALAVG